MQYGEDARVIAGGQSLVPMMNLRMARPAVLVDLASIPQLSGIKLEEGSIRIGAMTRQCELLTNDIIRQYIPLVSLAVAHIGHFQTRRRGTVGGSLAHADPSAELSLAMVTLDANLRLQNMRGERIIPAREFFVDALTTVLSEGEVLTDIIIPLVASDARSSFRECARRHGDFAIASAAVVYSASTNFLSASLGGVGAVPHLCANLCEEMKAASFDLDKIHELIGQELRLVEPMSDLNASAGYRRHVASSLLLECLRDVLEND